MGLLGERQRFLFIILAKKRSRKDFSQMKPLNENFFKLTKKSIPCTLCGLPAVGRKEKRVGNNFKCHLLKEKMLTKVSPQLRLQLSF